MPAFRTTLRFMSIPKGDHKGITDLGSDSVNLLNEKELQEIDKIAKNLTAGLEQYVDTEDLTATQRYFLATLRMLGAVSTLPQDKGRIRFARSGKIAAQLPKILAYYLRSQYVFIDDWSRLILNEDHLSAAELVNELEYQRVLQDRSRGVLSINFDTRPSAFAVICATTIKGERAYLFEVNKDWNRYNLIGGKQADSDNGSYEETVRREITEELGISRDRIRLYRLNEEPIEGWAISANAGGLTSYPCVLFGCTISGQLTVRLKDRWITEKDLRKLMNSEPERAELMVNPDYLSFLMDGMDPVIRSVPVSLQERVKASSVLSTEDERGWKRVLGRWSQATKDNKDLIGAVAGITSIITSLIAAFF